MLKLVLLTTLLFATAASAKGLTPLPVHAIKSNPQAAAKLVALKAQAKPVSTLKSFREWKSEKIQASLAQVDQTTRRVQDLRLKAQSPAQKNALENVEQQLSQEEWNLEIAQDLTVTDYLVLYLASQNVSGKFNEAAGKLTSDETAQVLEAYVRNMNAVPNHGQGLLPSAAIQNR
ncbi:MAG: hypothetical protein KF681_15735 [Bdellovibrionaceae bacterium]|nr:hypothetical protein [Pseudobdellovibrionaceae bacterium]